MVLPVAAVHPDDGGLVAIGFGIRAWSTERLSPISGESLDMQGMETVAERMADFFVSHQATMPGSGQTLQAVVSDRCPEDRTLGSIMTILGCSSKTTWPTPKVSLTHAMLAFDIGQSDRSPTRTGRAGRHYAAIPR